MPDNQNRLVVIAEDDETLNLLFIKILKRSGFTVQSFYTAAQLLEKADTFSPDALILLDYSLPDKTGRDVILELKKRELNIPFVIVTGHGDESLAVEMMKLGAEDYIVKSGNITDLLPAKIEHAFEQIENRKKLKSAETAVQAAAQQWEMTFQSIPDAIFILNKDHTIRQCNTAAADLLGKSANSLIGANCCKLLHGSSNPVDSCPVSSMMASLTRESSEMKVGDRYFLVTADPIFDENKDFIGGVHVLQDITSRKLTENSMRIMYEIEGQLLRTSHLEDAYRLAGRKIHELLGGGLVAVTMLDETIQAIRTAGLYGFGKLIEQFTAFLKVDVTKQAFYIKDMTEDELRIFRSGKLEKFSDGLYALMTRKIPKKLCDMAEKTLGFSGIYTMGFVSAGMHYGGCVILAKKDISGMVAMIETIMNQTAVCITRIRADKALRESEEKYRTLVEMANDGIIIVQDGIVKYANSRMAELDGTSVDQIVNTPISAHIHPDQVPKLVENYQRRIAGEIVPTTYETVLQRKDGTAVPSELNAGIISFEGKPADLVIIRDITERKRAEEALRKSEEKYKFLVDKMQEIALILDKTGKLLFANKSALESFGYREDEVLGKSMAAFLAKGSLKKALWALAQEFLGIHNGAFEVEVKNKNGEIRTLLIADSSNPVYQDGKMTGILISASDITERKRAEDSLRESEQKYRNVVENANEAIVIAQDNRLVYANPKAVAMMQTPLENIIRRPFADFIHPDDRALVVERYKQRLQGGKIPGSYDFRIIGNNGQIAWVYISAVLITWQGRPATLNFLTDITERKIAESALAKSEMEYRSLFENSVMGISEALPNGRLIRANMAYAKMYGYDSPEDIITEVADIGHQLYADPEDRKEVLRLLSEKGIMEPREIMVMRRDGTRFYVMVSAREVKDSAGNLLCYQATHVDIAKRKQAEEALQESEERLRLFLEHSPIYMFFKDEKIRSLQLSKNYEKMLGKPLDQLLGKSMAELFPSDLARIMEEDDKRILCEGKPVEIVEELDGRTYTTVKFPIKRKDKPPLLAGFTIDITDQKKAEEEKARLEERLRQAQKMEAIGQLAGGVAHDFNNLLAGMMGNAELLKMHLKEDKELVRYIDKIINTLGKTAGLTGQLLTFARKARVNITLFDIHTSIGIVIELLKHSIDRRITIKTSFNASPSKISGDSGLIENALLNISINARDAMPNGGTLLFETSNALFTNDNLPANSMDMQPGAYICVAITDTGTGMDPDTRDRIFEPFFTTKEVGKGTGLGLAAVYGCVRQHNGHIIVESEKGKGSTFTICFPAATPNDTEHEPIQAQAPIKGKGNVLIIDDEETIGEAVMELLKSIGYSPIFFSDPQLAIDHYKKNYQSISVVILDFVMPNLNGLQVFRELKRIQPQTKAIIASGYSDEKYEKEILQEGAQAIIQKPFQLSELSRALANAIGKE